MLHPPPPGNPPGNPPTPGIGTCPISCNCVNSSYVDCTGHDDITELSVVIIVYATYIVHSSVECMCMQADASMFALLPAYSYWRLIASMLVWSPYLCMQRVC